jgi:Tse6 toxin immunity protein Tsi6
VSAVRLCPSAPKVWLAANDRGDQTWKPLVVSLGDYWPWFSCAASEGSTANLAVFGILRSHQCPRTHRLVTDLAALVDKALAMVEERALGGAPIYDSIRAQLTFIRDCVSANSKPSDAELKRLLLGVYAAREFETSDPKFADVLFEVEYLFKRF